MINIFNESFRSWSIQTSCIPLNVSSRPFLKSPQSRKESKTKLPNKIVRIWLWSFPLKMHEKIHTVKEQCTVKCKHHGKSMQKWI